MTAAIELFGLSKSFRVRESRPGLGHVFTGLFSATAREIRAVQDVSFRIEAGERVAFVGPNGAGKSTTLKMLSGILRPTSGSGHVSGLVPWEARKQLAYRIGAVFGQRSQLWYHLPAADTFDLLAHVYSVSPDVHRRRRNELVDAFDIGPLLEKPVRTLSLGERMRCEVVASLLHAPQLLFLDEPTIGLDVTARATLRDLLREQSERRGWTILLTSHDTGDMERVCDRVIVIHGGRLLLDETMDRLRRHYIRRKQVTLRTAEASVDLDLHGVRVLDRRPHETRVEVDVATTPVEVVVQAALSASKLHDLTVEDPPMEQIIQSIYQAAERSAALPSPLTCAPAQGGACDALAST